MNRDIGIRISDEWEPEVVVIRDTEGKIRGGLVVGNILEQNQAMLLLCHKGEIKEFGEIGLGIEDMLNDNELDRWKRDITYMLSQDGMKVKRLEIGEEEIRLEAEYE